ncbi:Spore protease GPR related protein [Lachnospiraceae bacterium TWA4]|nr:Spore protease GPR related protein [Lachnospiraceae bacterium TWA4]
MIRREVRYYPSGVEFSPEHFGKNLWELINEEKKKSSKEKILFVCIGSDRSTGDSLGPFVGSMLSKRWGLKVLGTLNQPVHAMNLLEYMQTIKERYADYLIVAIDASIGKKEHLSQITLSKGAIRPGLGVNKELASIGDIAITGIVGWNGKMESFLLQNTRLSLIVEIAESIYTGIVYCDYLQRQSKVVDEFLVPAYKF